MEQNCAEPRRSRADDNDGGGGGGGGCGGDGGGDGRSGHSRLALFALSCLLLMLGMMLARHYANLPLIPLLHLTSSPPLSGQQEHRQHPLHSQRDHKHPIYGHHPQEHHHQHQHQHQQQQDRSGRGVQGCSRAAGFGWITDLVLTPDGRLVLSNWQAEALVVLESSREERVIPLGVRPLSLALLGNGVAGGGGGGGGGDGGSGGQGRGRVRLAVTSGTNEILLVDLDRPGQGVPLSVQRVPTEKAYSSVTSGLNETTLIVSTSASATATSTATAAGALPGYVSIDMITVHGEVVETLINTAHFGDLRYCHFLSRGLGTGGGGGGGEGEGKKTGEEEEGEVVEVWASALDGNNRSSLVRVYRQASGSGGAGAEWRAERLFREELATGGHLWATVGHRAWGMFVSQDAGVILLRTASAEVASKDDDDEDNGKGGERHGERQGERQGGRTRVLHVLKGTDPLFYPTALAVTRNRLFVVWDHVYVADFVLQEYLLLRL